MTRVLAILSVLLGVPAAGQSTPDLPLDPPQPYDLDSGRLANPADRPSKSFVGEVSVEGAAWLRVYFGEVVLAPGGVLRLTSQLDGEVQLLDAGALAAWGGASAYFNGDTVTVELISAPRASGDRVVVEQVAFQLGAAEGAPGACGICGEDDRAPSNELWAARLLPSGCTATVYNEQSCFVSAGHCIAALDMVMQFNVPASSPNCIINHPPVSDQFPVIDEIFDGPLLGNDWAVLTTGTNNLGETAWQRYGQLRPIANALLQPGDPVEVTGYGLDETCTLSGTQQTSDGTLTSLQSDHDQFVVDLRPGNSGSAVIAGGAIIGVVSHCLVDCPNFATRVDLPVFASARFELCPGPDACAADLDGDGAVGVTDLLELLAAWGQAGVPADLDGGGVGITDFLALLAAWGPCPAQAAVVAVDAPATADGGAVVAVDVIVANLGPETADIPVTVQVDDAAFDCAAASVAPGATGTATCAVTMPSPPINCAGSDNVAIAACVTDGGDPADDCGFATVDVNPTWNLVFDVYNATASVAPGGSASWWLRVRNVGSVASPASLGRMGICLLCEDQLCWGADCLDNGLGTLGVLEFEIPALPPELWDNFPIGSYPIPPDTPPGTYHIKAGLDLCQGAGDDCVSGDFTCVPVEIQP